MIFRRRYLGCPAASSNEVRPTGTACVGGPQKVADDFWAANKDVLGAAMGPSLADIRPTRWMEELAAEASFSGMLSDEPLMAFYNTHLKALLQGECTRFCADAAKCMDGEDLVKFFTERWREYHRRCTVLSHLLVRCDNRLAGIRASRSHAYMRVLPTACRAWAAAAEDAGVAERLGQSLCSVIREARETGESSARDNLVKECLDALVAIGVDKADPGHAVSKDIYVKWFEKLFLVETTRFYAEEAAAHAPEGTGSLVALMTRRVAAEEARLEHCLQHDPTAGRLASVLNGVFVRPYRERLVEYFGDMLRKGDEEALGHTYALLSRVVGYVDTLFPLIQAQIEREGMAVMEAAAAVDAKTPELYVRAVVSVHSKYKRIIAQRLCGNRNIEAILSIACAKFANKNAFVNAIGTEANGGPKAVAAQCVASYADTVLKKGKDAAESVDAAGVVAVFGFLEDKDIFMFYHARKLASRLLNGLSSSVEDEKTFLAQIKDANNFNDPTLKKMEDMIKDVEHSTALQPLFAEYLAAAKQQEQSAASTAMLPAGSLYMRVLNKLNWSISVPDADRDFFIPSAAVRNALAAYEAFYLKQKEHTRFVHVHSQSRAEVEFRSGAHHHYRMMASAYQAAVLLLFAESNGGASELTLSEIAAQLHVPYNDILLSVLGISKVKILLPSSADPSSWDASTVFKFNAKFMSKKPKFNLPQERSLSITKPLLSSSSPPSSSSSSQSASIINSNDSCSKSNGGSTTDGSSGNMKVETAGAAAAAAVVVGTPSEADMKEVENSRIECIKATVVRVMKKRKVLSFNELHSEVAALLKKRFVMPPKLFKRAVEWLVDKEFLRRTGSDNVTIEYIS